MRLLVCGDRHWTDEDVIRDWITEHKAEIEIVMHGCAPGADTIAGNVAREFGIPVLEFLPDWAGKGRAAGPIRNKAMLIEGQPTLVLAFHSNIAKSKGTANMLAQAKRAGVQTMLIEATATPQMDDLPAEEGLVGRRA